MKFKYKTKLLALIFTIICGFGVIESAIYKKRKRFILPKFWNVKERFSYIRNNTRTFDLSIEDSNILDGDSKGEKSSIQEEEIFTKEEKKNYVENKYESLETIREDLIRNWAFNIKYGSGIVVKETYFRIIMHFVRKTMGTKEIRKEQVIDEIDKKNILNREDPNEDSVFFNLKRKNKDDKFIKELSRPINSISKCWEIYSKITTSYRFELFERDFDSFKDSEAQDSTSETYLEEESDSENTKRWRRFEYNQESLKRLGIEDAVKLVEPIPNIPKLNRKSKMLGKQSDRNKFLLRLTCEFYMKAMREIQGYLKDEYEQYDFNKIQVESKIYHTWKKLYLRSPSNAMWYLFKQIIPIRGDLTVFGLSNGNLPLLPCKERMSIPDIPPDFFEYTTMPRSCSNNLVALSLNNGYRIQLGITKTPKYIQFGKLYRYFEHSLTTSFTSLNLCMRTIKLQTLYQAYYYQSVNEYRPDPTSYFYWQTPDWDSLAGYISYLPSNSKALFPGRNQFVWCLLWATTEYSRTFSRFRINPIKITVKDILHIPMKMQKIGNRPNLEACFILIRYFWLAKLIKINKRKYRPLKTNSPKDVILDYSSIYYVCIAILKCRATFHRSYLKHFRQEDINPAIEKVFDTQDPHGDYNNLNNRFLILSIPKLKSLKKVKAVLYGVVSTVLFGAITGITLLNILTNNQIPSDQIMRSGYHNPLQDFNLIQDFKF
ncbi:hypothetical protein CmeUKMEL1_15015 [Cryptosporidium meleagridis]|uniref:Uncharacterized protein n=1 Tax=Cryptosporidium meleagridis TaxID=93969 RepID=A0A2P4Z4H4_9CRYT|nr:hypothetical protein CmeUKMEL1_15015 [Cryptosporidium meleagridis]